MFLYILFRHQTSTHRLLTYYRVFGTIPLNSTGILRAFAFLKYENTLGKSANFQIGSADGQSSSIVSLAVGNNCGSWGCPSADCFMVSKMLAIALAKGNGYILRWAAIWPIQNQNYWVIEEETNDQYHGCESNSRKKVRDMVFDLAMYNLICIIQLLFNNSWPHQWRKKRRIISIKVKQVVSLNQASQFSEGMQFQHIAIYHVCRYIYEQEQQLLCFFSIPAEHPCQSEKWLDSLNSPSDVLLCRCRSGPSTIWQLWP